ncbi:unnamed protein product [Protopolystoma xenopodis]|uniref:Large ribosomal subunit protein mL64 n=1 Tax=Protopolystoma xenopodis TaxID=117903 RepID=A0A3S5CJA9_9PLAT|nr:unnamed protein product [Protopolystoma xenopodis]
MRLYNSILLRCPNYFFIPLRGRKYYINWRSHDQLTDYQNLTRGWPSVYEQWHSELKDSILPSEFQALDINRLPRHLRSRSKCKVEPFLPIEVEGTPLDYKRRLYALYGSSSLVDPSELFPTSRDIKYERLKESQFERPVMEVINEKKDEKEAFKLKVAQTMKNIQREMEKMPKLIEKLNSHQAALRENKILRESKNKELLEEARDRFGYRVDIRDEKFLKLKQEKFQEEIEDKKRIKRGKKSAQR